MSTIKDLVQPQCGQSNALVDLANKFFPSKAAKQRSKQLTSRKTNCDDLVSEFLVGNNASAMAPSSFNMRSLLEQISVRSSDPAKQSTKETEICIDNWIADFKKDVDTLDDNFEKSSENAMLFDKLWSNAYTDRLSCGRLNHSDLKWSVEYLQEAEDNPIRDLSNTWITNTESSQQEHEWRKEFEEFLFAQSDRRLDVDEELYYSNFQENKNAQVELNEIWNGSEQDVKSWADEYYRGIGQQRGENHIYQFKIDNPHMDAADPLSAGKQSMAEGDLANAVLYFESAVQKEPQNAEAWQYLGQAQAENEHETKTIAALRRCLELQPNNLDALLVLSIAYTNEALYDSACRSLFEWLKINPKYTSFAQNVDFQASVPSTSLLDRNLFAQVEGVFLRAINERADIADPDLQNALGVLYNMSGDLQKAADCFRTALLVKPDDPRLWNRLGATLANDQRSAEAIYAYRKALELYPGFVRARYNLGVSCLNLGSHEQAVDHLISALTLQRNGIGPSGEVDMSQTIWSTLRVAACCLKRPNGRLLSLIDAKDFEALKRSTYAANSVP